MRIVPAVAGVVFLVLVAPPFAAEAQLPSPFMDGKELREGLEAWDSSWSDLFSDKSVDSGIAYGFVVGVADALDGVAFCLPERITRGQIKDIVLEHLREHPEGENRRASRLATAALEAAFPCRQ